MSNEPKYSEFVPCGLTEAITTIVTTKDIEDLGFKKRGGSRKEVSGNYSFKGEHGQVTLHINVKTCSLYVKNYEHQEDSGFVFSLFYFKDLEDIKKYLWASRSRWGFIASMDESSRYSSAHFLCIRQQD